MALFECLSCNEGFLESDRFSPLEGVTIPLCTVNCTELTQRQVAVMDARMGYEPDGSELQEGKLVFLFTKDGKKTERIMGHLYTIRKKTPEDSEFIPIALLESYRGPKLNPEWEEINPWGPNYDQYVSVFVANCCSCNGSELYTMVEAAGTASRGPRWGEMQQGDDVLHLKSSYAKWVCAGVDDQYDSDSDACQIIFCDSAPIELTKLDYSDRFVSGMNCRSGELAQEDEYSCWHFRDGPPGGWLVEIWPYESSIQLLGKVIGSGYVCSNCC